MPKVKTHGQDKLPDELFVERQYDNNETLEDSWLSSSADSSGLIDQGETKRVAVYRFDRFVELVNRTEVRNV